MDQILDFAKAIVFTSLALIFNQEFKTDEKSD